jgi:hypothetical protein
MPDLRVMPGLLPVPAPPPTNDDLSAEFVRIRQESIDTTRATLASLPTLASRLSVFRARPDWVWNSELWDEYILCFEDWHEQLLRLWPRAATGERLMVAVPG